MDTSDIGLVMGIQIDIDKFFATGRYELGFNNVVSAVSGGTTNNNVQNGLVTLMIGYSFL